MQGSTVETVLIVDDDRDIADALSLALQGYGHKVAAAYSAREALDLLDENHEICLGISLTIPVKPRSCSLAKCGSAEKIATAIWISCTTEVVIETRGLLESVRCRLVRRLRRKRADGHERTLNNMLS